MAKTVLKLNATTAVVKVTDTQTIGLATDLKTATETIFGTPTVNILGCIYTGAAASTINVTRNSISILDIAPQYAQTLLFNEHNEAFVDNIQNTFDIVVTVSGAAEIYLLLRKVLGYKVNATVDQLGPYGIEGQ